MKSGLFICLWCVYTAAWSSNAYYVHDPVGWHWNNVPVQSTADNQSKDRKAHDPVAQLKFIQQALNEAKAQAVLNPTTSNIQQYLAMQQWVSSQSSRFAANWQKVLLLSPALNYGIDHPTESQPRQRWLEEKTQQKVAITRAIAMQYGLFFFYQGKNAMDQLFAKEVVTFAHQYGFALIGIPMDNQAIGFINNNQRNQGQAERLGIQKTPALFLVDPRSRKTYPLAYGYLSQDELLEAVFNVATNYEGDPS